MALLAACFPASLRRTRFACQVGRQRYAIAFNFRIGTARRTRVTLAAACWECWNEPNRSGSTGLTGSHPEVRAIVSIHGLQDAADKASGPILLLTSEGDTFVTKSGFVQPCYDRSSVQPTMLVSHTAGDHLDPIDAASPDWEPAVAWLRYWLYGDQSKKAMFFGASCTLCSWPDVQRKNASWD